MDWFVTTTNTWVNWSDRVDPSYAVWLFVPYEVAVALCNKLSRDMWLNLPMCASSAYITSLVSLIYSGGTDTNGTVWAGLNSNLNIYVEDGNEVWNAGPNFNNNIVQNQSRISQSYAAYPGFKTANTRCQFTGSVAANVGQGTSTLTVASISTGSIYNLATTGQGSIWDTVSGTVADGSYVTAQLTGSPGGTGTYTILHEQNVSSRPLTQGDDYRVFVQNHIRRTIVYGNTFKATFGSRCIITMGGQVGGATASYTTALATAFGGNGSDWSGPSGRAMDAYATAPYFGSGAWCTSIPNSATPAQVVQELTDSSVYGIYIPFGTGSCSGTTLTIAALNRGNPAPFLYPGAPITSPGFQPGCTVVTQLRGATGGIGTYTVNTSQTVAAGSTISGPVGAVAEQGVQSFIDWRIANSFGKVYVCYECGQSLVSSDARLKTTFMNAQRQSGFYDLYKLYYQTLNGIGASVACHFVDASPYTLD